MFYRWKNRFDELGPEGLRDRSSRPRNSPTATKGEVVERIVHLRQNYHLGPARIAMHLKRCHDVEISSSGVWRVLHRLGLGRLPANQRCEKQHPGHRVQIDVKFIAPIGGVATKRHCQFTAIDDTDMFNDRLRAWEDYYNLERPHGGLDGHTPYERLKQKTSQP